MEIIKGIDALKRMKEMQSDIESFFVMHHLTWNSTKGSTNGMRIVERARLRKALPAEYSGNIEPDQLLPYIDLQNDKLGMCYKPLIRQVAFPPDYKPLTVRWHARS